MLLTTNNSLFEASVDTTPDFWSLPESAAVAWSPVLHAAELRRFQEVAGGMQENVVSQPV